ncbi:MAG: hypothetical protein RL329_3177 [Bacteroidota bacterium]|jgi:hypothetical protein
MWKKIILGCLLLPTYLLAQNQPAFSEDYHTMWLRGMLIYRTKWANYQFEGLFRQQENEFAPPYWAGPNNPLAAPLIRGLRFWAVYNTSKRWRMDFATSWFGTYPTIRAATDVGKPYLNDFRLTFLPLYTYRINRLEISSRTGGEIMFIYPHRFDSLTIRQRFRIRPMLKYKVAPQLWASIFDEFFVSTTTNGLRYDQHRPAGMLHFEPKTNHFLEGGVFVNYKPNEVTHGITWLLYYNRFF